MILAFAGLGATLTLGNQWVSSPTTVATRLAAEVKVPGLITQAHVLPGQKSSESPRAMRVLFQYAGGTSVPISNIPNGKQPYVYVTVPWDASAPEVMAKVIGEVGHKVLIGGCAKVTLPCTIHYGWILRGGPTGYDDHSMLSSGKVWGPFISVYVPAGIFGMLLLVGLGVGQDGRSSRTLVASNLFASLLLAAVLSIYTLLP